MVPPRKAYTATMAKLYAEQGYLRKAAEIYRHLLEQQPQRRDLSTALADIQRKIDEREAPTRKDTELLLREWIAMLKKSRPRKRSGPTYQRRRKEDEESRHD